MIEIGRRAGPGRDGEWASPIQRWEQQGEGQLELSRARP